MEYFVRYLLYLLYIIKARFNIKKLFNQVNIIQTGEIQIVYTVNEMESK